MRPEDSQPYNPSPGGGYGYYWTDWDNTKRLELNLLEAHSLKINRITFHRTYSNFRPQIQWVNEKLVYIRVYWGRVIGTDLIFDMESGSVIYQEMLHDGTALFMQTREQAEDPEKVEKELVALRERLIPTMNTNQAEIESVYGKGRIRETSKGFFVQDIHLTSEVSLTLLYQGKKLLERPWLGHGPNGEKGGGGNPGTGEYLSGKWVTQQTNLMILNELLEVEKKYHDRLNEASWNKSGTGEKK